jgi:hypothetical protein
MNIGYACRKKVNEMTTTTNLIERLRSFEDIDPNGEELMLQAADLIEAQAKQIEALQADAERIIVTLQFQLLSASNYIDELGGNSKTYRRTLEAVVAARKGNV